MTPIDNSKVKQLPTSSARAVTTHSRLNNHIVEHDYPGSGTSIDPYIITWLDNDSQNPLAFSAGRKWSITLTHAFSFFAVTFGSSVYASGIFQVMQSFNVSEEVAILGLALYALGFAVGPILWAPMSEVYGRKMTFMVSYTCYMAFAIAAPFSPNITTLLVVRFFGGAFGASTQTNPGGMISDMFAQEDRGPVMTIFAACPFLGPALGPIVGGFLASSRGWPWLLGVNAIISGVVWIAALLATKETYALCILQSRARAQARTTGKHYVSKLAQGQPIKTVSQEFEIAFTRPWILMIFEPIVLLSAIYISIIYATLYLFFAAIPIVFEGSRGWDQGTAGLPFIGVIVGVCFAVVAAGVDAKHYARLTEAAAAAGKYVEPEARLQNAIFGAVILPIGLFLFAWTTYSSVHWIAPIIGATIFSCGLMMVFISLITYLVDTYTIYVASALAANTIMRSFFAAAFPLFTAQMYAALGDQWASSILAFLVLACLPVPFLFNTYGRRLRLRCKYAAEAARMTAMMKGCQMVSESDVKEMAKERAV